MARASSSSTKFASVNLNKSYGKPAAPQGAQLPGSGTSRSRIATHGGMLLLTRPVRSQPVAAAVQKGAKLTVPLPVNLPSLRREHAGNDPTIALVGGTGASGWPKQQLLQVEEAAVPSPLQGESNAAVARSTPALSAGSTWGTSQSAPIGQPTNFASANGESGTTSAPQMVTRSGVYTPPRARSVQVKPNVVLPPSRPAAVEKAVVLRGEDFPTLQAALPPAPPPPQHRQKELQQRQREKQQELKDQHQKLQQLSQKHPGDEPLQQQVVGPQLQPLQPVTLQPKQLPTHNMSNESGFSLEPHAAGQAGSKPGVKSEGFSSYAPAPLVRLNQRSNWTDDEREPAQNLRPQGGQGQYSEWPDRPEREHFLGDPRRNNPGDDYGIGRQSSHRENLTSFGMGSREGGFGRDVDMGRESGFSADSAYAREGNIRSGFNLPNNHNREDRYGREGLGSRDGFPGREGGFGIERAHGKDGGYNRESGIARDGVFGREGGYGRPGGFGRDGGGGGREYAPNRETNLDRDGFGRPGAGIRDFAHDRESFSFRDGFGKETGPREAFHRDGNYGRDGNFSRDAVYGRENRRPQGGEYEVGRGRYNGERFGRGGPGRSNVGSEFNGNKSGPFSSGRGIIGLDSGLDFSREKRFGMPYSEDAFAKDFPDLPGLDFRASSGLGESLTGLESKLIRKKKEEAKVSAFYDLEREAFEAELERVQKLQEQERLRKLEEKERALEQARKDQEEQERLAREEVERQLRLEQEARDAAARAEQEALEAARKVEEEKRAREEEKRSIQLEEERRKENARRKLLELEERIARREAEKKKQEEDALLPEDDRLRNQRQPQEYEVAVRREVVDKEEEQVVVGLTGADQDDDDRAPLRPSRRPASPLMSRSTQDEFSARVVKSPDVQNSFPAGRRGMPDVRGGNAFEPERSRSFNSWRRDSMDNGGPLQTSLYGREEMSEFSMTRDRIYPGRGYGEREILYGSPNNGLTTDGVSGEYSTRKDRVQGYQERRWVTDEVGPSNKRSASPRATTPESDGGYLESSFDRDGDRHWGRDKLDRQRMREVKRLSPPPPSSYLQGPDTLESYGRLRHSLPKQPRVPPPPLRAPLQRPPLKSARDLANTSPSPLLHPATDDSRGPSWKQDGPPEHHSKYVSRPVSRSSASDSAVASSRKLDSQRESLSSQSEKSQVREVQGPLSSLRLQQNHLPSPGDSRSESQDEGSEQLIVGREKALSSPRDDSSLPPTTPESHTELDEAGSNGDVSPIAGGAREEEEDEADYAEDEEEEGEEEENDGHRDAGGDQEEEGFEDEEEVAGEWEDDLEPDIEKDERTDQGGTVEFLSEYGSGTLEGKEESGSEVDYKGYEHSSEQQLEEDVKDLKLDYNTERVNKETSVEEPPDMRLQEHESSQQAVAQPFLQHITLPSSTLSLTSIIPVQNMQGESYVSQGQHHVSFMALSLPQSNSTSATTHVPSLVAALPVLQNPQDGPMTLQFGLLPSTSLLPPVPAIQIGSIQMPLHLHQQSGTQVHGSQAPLFQFGQLGHQTALPSFMHPSPISETVVQLQNVNFSTSQLNGLAVPDEPVPVSQGKESYASEEDQGSLQPSQGTWVNQPSQNVVGDLKSTDGDENGTRIGGEAGSRPERSLEGGSHDSASTFKMKSLHRVGSEGALDSSSSDNSAVATVEASFDHNQGGDTSWQRPYSGGRGRGNSAYWPGPPSRGRGRSGSYGGRSVSQGVQDGSTVSSVNYSAEMGSDGVARTSRSRRSSYRRTEFKVRDSILPSERSYPDSLASSKQDTGREKYHNVSGWTDASVVSGNISDCSLSRDNQRDSASQLRDRSYYGDAGGGSHSLTGGRATYSSVGKLDRSGNPEATVKNVGRTSGYGGALSGKYSSEVASESPVMEHPGAEALSDEDDFIEVRSKRQMLNDRREQKEKEMKAKTKDMKAKEQAARKQRPPIKAGFQGESGVGTGSKFGGLAGPEKRSSIQPSTLEAINSSSSRISQSASSSAVVTSASLPASNIPSQLLAPIGTPAGGSSDMAYDKRSKHTKPRVNTISGGNLIEGDVIANSPYDNPDTISSTTLAWGGTRSTLQVVSLTQIQLEEAMKPVRFEGPVPQQLPFSERSNLVLEAVAPGKDKPSASPSGPVGSLLAGEKIQFGAVTSPPIALPSSRPLTPGLNAVVGSSLGPRADGASDDNELKSKSKRLSGAGNEVTPFTGKSKRTRGDEERGGDGVDAEAEAAASAVAVAAISSDESVGSTHHGDGQKLSLRGVVLSGPGNKSSFGKSSGSSSHSDYWPADTGISMGDANTSSGVTQGSGPEHSMSVALPADLSVEPTSISLQGPVTNSSGLLLPSLPGGGPLPYRGLEMGTMLGGPMFGFGTTTDASQGPQGVSSGSVHDQGSGSGSGGWQPQHSGGVDSYYAGAPSSSYAGPFINPTGGIPSIQGPPHMLVYTNPFASVSQFGQLGVSFMGPQQYLPSGKQPDWKHTPVSTSGPGAVGMSSGEVAGTLGGIISGQRSSGVSNNVQRMAPGPSVISAPGPFDLNLSAPFQIPGVEVSMQSQWSHVPGPPLHTVPISGPLMGFTMQSRHSRGPNHIGHLPHMMETTSGFNLVPASNPVSSGLFQSVDPAAQFPDELGLGDSSSPVTTTNSSFRSQRPSSRAPPVSSSIATPSGASAIGVNNSKLRSGRRASRVARGGSSLGGGGNGGGGIVNVGISSSSGASGQIANGSRAPSPHLQSPQMPPISLGQHSHPSPYTDQRGAPQQGLPRVGISSGGWSGQGRKGGGPGRPPVAERGSSGDKTFVSSSSKLKQVYVVKPSSSPRRNIGDASSNLFSGSESGQTAVGH